MKTASMPDLPLDFLDRLRTFVGPSGVSNDQAVRQSFARTMLPQGTWPAAVAWPSTREQVQHVLREASAHAIPVYPISRGKNWGYGDACASLDGCLILDLSRMNRIVEVNTDLAYAVVEPGVTQGQLVEYLKAHRCALTVDANGAGPDASLIGNILERGFGHSRYGDRFSHCCNFEVVLADGSLLNTGFGAYPEAQAQHVYKHGIGPSLDGLFTQSSLGVVTRLTLWLMPEAEHSCFFFVALKEDKAVGPFMDRLRPLFLSGTLRSTFHCFNDRRLLCGDTRFPWDLADGKQALEVQHPEVLKQLYRRFKIPAWGGSGGLTGTVLEVRAARQEIRRALRGLEGLDRLIFLQESSLRWIERGVKIISRIPKFRALTQFVGKIRTGVEVLKGTPLRGPLKGASWRSRAPVLDESDPLENQAGLIWIAPVVPMTGRGLADVLIPSEKTFHQFGFEFQVTVTCLNGRALCAVMSISFDRQSEDERARANACHQQLLGNLTEKGLIPYRSSSVFPTMLWEACPGYWQAVERLKAAWDPAQILSPNHYIRTSPSTR
jgi:4-cresol dehydrogenase (hydroxylating)